MGFGANETTPRTSDSTSATDFALISRLLTDAAAAFGGTAPGFRSPPRIPGVQRSVTRNRDGSVTVAVAVRGRPVMAVVADLIDGIILTSGTTGGVELYDALWSTAQDWLGTRQSAESSSRRHLRVAA